MRLERVVIIGNSATGKTTLARTLAARLNSVHIERDALQWETAWQKASDEAFREKVSEAIESPRWVADGNFSRVRDEVWGRADTLVWLDYPLWVILWRLIRRSWQRVYRQEELWNGNRERWGRLLARDGVFAWTIKAYFRHRREYPTLLQTKRFSHLQVIRLRSPAATQRWINSLE